ncbi:adenosylcobalamin-dependent ribonucleoside-diphosphate reductase (plasmid) [Halobacillus litoralis]|uniref:adenosylcobalamin-dependent ribonucleoside-diphosphate reductase n=1 Tax=Halobacillus litoralis TaxID=45668 RepID=UPI00273F73EE|nr:adenosylcobalamin-dependent ribonucleoside-diphosphate reductase [Halobacillus litoralis]WLR49615.1 adenosylcobalamin-dependent ribonucleoside-diphosphate reductase [Halobacillus litoralis]
MTTTLTGFQRKIHHTRYARKALDKEQHMKTGQPVVTLTKDGKYPTRELGTVALYDPEKQIVTVRLETGDYQDTFPEQLFDQDLHNVDVLLETEWQDTADRVAWAVAQPDHEYQNLPVSHHDFLEAIENFNLVPAGRILTGAGDDAKVTLFNCYVIDVEKPPHNPEAGVDSRQAIFHHQGRVAEIMARGGGVGTCLSVFRPAYAPLKQTKGRATGSVFIGNLLSGLTEFVEQANRRGAQMLTQHVWHPDVYHSRDSQDDFIGAKQKEGFMEGNNSSVLVTDDFMKALYNDEDWDLIFPDTEHPAYNEDWDGDINKWIDEHGKASVKVYKTVPARDIWDKIIEANWASAELGVIYIDRYNQMHNGWYLGTIMATNPCGEQGLLGNSTCNLSAVNFGRMIKVVGKDSEGIIYDIDWDKLEQTVETGVRFLDNIIDTTEYFDSDMEKQQKGERRLGLGYLGVHDLLIALRLKYGSEEAENVLDDVFSFFRDTAYNASIDLAIEKGAFPLYDDRYLESGFVKTLPQEIQDRIKLHGIRNLTILTVAPTGTTGSMTPSLLSPEDSVSTGVEPHFAMKYERMSRIGTTTQYAGVAKAWKDEHPDQELPEYFIGAMELSPEAHVAMQAVAQRYVDSSISKTVNAPKDHSQDQVDTLYRLAYEKGLKGVTYYRDGSRYEQILSVGEEDGAEEETEEQWECGSCGSKKFHMVENCKQCAECGMQACSL